MKRLNLLVFFLLFLVGSVLPVQAAITALDGFNPNVNGTIVAVAVQADGKLLIGGDFTQVGGVARNRIARLNTDGSLDTAFNPNANNSVEVLVAQPDGTILVGGLFSNIGGASRSRVALLNSDGTAHTGFTISVTNGDVVAIAVEANGNVLIGGTFTDIGGTPRNHLARLNKATPWVLDTTFNPDVTGGTVYAIDLQVDGTIVAGGSFTHVGGGVRSRIARIKADGSLQADGFAAPAFSFGIADEIYSLRIHPDGDILIGGSFTLTQGFDTVHNLARTSFDGVLRTGFMPEPNGFVDSVLLQADGNLLVGGGFTGFIQAGNPVRNRIARVINDSAGTVDAGFAPAVSDGVPSTTVYAIAQQADGKILVAGNYGRLNGTVRNNLSRLYLNGALEIDFDLNVTGGGTVYAVAVHPADGTVIVGGDFTAIGGVSRNGLARFDATGNIDETFNPNITGTVYALALQADDKIIAGGSFSAVGGNAAANIARINSNGSYDASLDAATDNAVYTVAVESVDDLLVGGLFLNVNGLSQNYMARIKAANGALDLTFWPDPDNPVRTMAIEGDGRILIGGMFHTVRGVARNHLARIDPTYSDPVYQIVDSAFDPNVNDVVHAIGLLPNGSMVIGGAFTTVGAGASPPVRNRIAKLSAAGALDANFSLSADNIVYALAVRSNTEMVIAGAFTSIGNGNVRDHVAKLTADGGGIWSLDVTFKPVVNDTVYAAAVADTSYVIGGRFTKVDSNSRTYAAMLGATGVLDPDFNKFSGRDVYAVALQPDGKIIIGGNFVRIGGENRNHIARINIDGTIDTAFNPDVDGIVRAIAVQADGKIVIGGMFTTVGGGATPNRNHLARLLADGTLDTYDPNVNGDVNAIAVQADGKIVIGGAFTTVGTGGTLATRNNVARLDGTTGEADGYDPNVNGDVNAIALQADGKIVIGGAFTTTGTGGTLKTRNRIARLDGTTGVADDFNPDMNGNVNAIALQSDGKIVAGGAFTTVGSTSPPTRNHIARVSSAGVLDGSFDPNVEGGDVNTITIQADGSIVIGGLFTSITGTGGAFPAVRNYIARVNSAGVFDTAFLPTVDGGIHAVALQQDGKIIIGGSFGFVGGLVRSNIARLINTDAALQSLTIPTSGSSITWNWGQASPEIGRVTFETSSDMTTWTAVPGTPARVSGDWQLTGITPPLPQNSNFYIRARGYRGDGQYNGSGSIIETVRLFHLATAPVVDALLGAGNISAYYAELRGTVTGGNTVVTFEYGPTTSYGTSVSASQSPLSGSSATTVSRFLIGLTPATTYNYRVKGVNAHYTVYSTPNTTFATTADPIGTTSVTVVSQSLDTPKTIPDNSFVESTITGINCASIHDLNVAVSADHPSLNELLVTLRNTTSAKEIELMNATACGSANMDLILDDDAVPANPVQTAGCGAAAPALDGVFVPKAGLSAFDNDDGSGNWILKITDTGGANNTGTLKNWGMIFTCVNKVTVTKTVPANPEAGDTATVTSSPAGINCGTGCLTAEAPFAPTSTVNLTAAGTGNWAFDNWTGSCACTYLSCPTGVCSLTMNANKASTAEFVKVADFATYNMPDNAVYFADLSVHNPTAWLWDFGDTPVNTSPLQNPTYIYQSAAPPFTVTLTVTVNAQQYSVQKLVTPQVCAETNLAKIAATYATLQAAYNAAGAGSEILVHASSVSEGFAFDTNTNNILITGGFDCDFVNNPSFTTLTWPMTVGGTGSVTVEGIIIQ